MENSRQTGAKRPQWQSELSALFVCLILIAVIWLGFYLSSFNTQQGELPIGGFCQAESFAPPPKTFDGPSDNLRETLVVPTLDTPIPPGKSVIWCGTIQLAWNELRQNITRGDAHLQGAQEIADRLNRAQFNASDLNPNDCYAAAGWVKDGIVDRIRGEIGRRFPDALKWQLDLEQTVFVAFGYLRANVPFTIPYDELPAGLRFTDSKGKESRVEAFGFSRLSDDVELSGQIEVLFDSESEFALDLCRTSQPYQIVAATVPPAASLAGVLTYVTEKLDAQKEDENRSHHLRALKFPVMNWQIDHRFHELEGAAKPLLNPAGTWLVMVQQITAFRLDRSGAHIESMGLDAGGNGGGSGGEFYFRRPYLVYIKKRDALQPFFVMWVDNAELLVPHRLDGSSDN
jgi:hypothetical protein